MSDRELSCRAVAGRFRPPSRRVLSVLVMLLVAGCAGDAVPDPPFATSAGPDYPPVVFVVIDTLRADHLGVYGSDRGLTPNLDALASEAHVFERAVAPSSWTRSSVASMLTSRYPTALGVLGRNDTLDPRFATFPEMLHHIGGYTTVGLNGNGNVAASFGFGNGFDVYRMPRLRRSYPGDFAIPVAEGLTAEALELVDSREEGDPFLLYALYVDPHDPYLPHPDLTGDEPPGRFSGARQDLLALDRPGAQPTPADRQRIRFLYSGEVRYVDHWIGELLRGLRERGLYDDAMIVITSDHGEGLWDHGMRAHGTDLYEEQIHVPLIVKYPGMTAENARRIETLVGLVDLAPTILEVVGLTMPSSFQGRDLTPLVRGEDRGPAFQYVYSELDLDGRAFESIRKGSLKLIAHGHGSATANQLGTRELYDLSEDPGEQNDLLTNDPGPTPLDPALQKWSSTLLAAAPGQRRLLRELDPETERSLRALGYLGNPRARPIDSRDAGRADNPGGGRPGGRDSEGRAAPRENLEIRADPTRSAIRFGDEGIEGADQILRGLESPPTRSGTAAPSPSPSGALLGEEASVRLLRRRNHRHWRIGLTVTGSTGGRRTVLDVRIDDEEPVRTTLTESGEYVIEGRLPERVAWPPGGAPRTLRLTLRCSVRSDDSRITLRPAEKGCVTIREISLR